MNREEIMLWLNDRLGRPITVTLYLERNGAAEDLFSSTGTLRHWSTTCLANSTATSQTASISASRTT
jgi:hypothetical protein